MNGIGARAMVRVRDDHGTKRHGYTRRLGYTKCMHAEALSRGAGSMGHTFNNGWARGHREQNIKQEIAKYFHHDRPKHRYVIPLLLTTEK